MMRFWLVIVCGLLSGSASGGLLSGSASGGLLFGSAWAAQTINLQARTAGELAALCGTDPSSAAADAKINFCHGFAQGAIDDRMRAGGTKLFCFPSPAPQRSATMREFVGWVRSNPENREMPVLDGLFKFLGERYPCKS
jgi:hypothetical protein